MYNQRDREREREMKRTIQVIGKKKQMPWDINILWAVVFFCISQKRKGKKLSTFEKSKRENENVDNKHIKI